MVKIRFRQDRVVQDGLQGTPHEMRFSAGDIVDLPEASANHWLTRGVADRVAESEEPSTPPAPPEAGASEAAPPVEAPHLEPQLDDPEAAEGDGAEAAATPDVPASMDAEIPAAGAQQGESPAAVEGTVPAGAEIAPSEPNGARQKRGMAKPAGKA